MELKPISPAEFKNALLRPEVMIDEMAFYNFFEPYIKQAKNFAVAPYFWLIPNQENMTLLFASDNIGILTPFAKEEWINKDSFFWMNTIHPDDQGFVGASITMLVKIHETLTEKQADTIRVNIYCKMLNAESNYRWVLIQFPKNIYDANGQISSTLILTTDLSHLEIELKCMATVIDAANNKFNYFSTSLETQNLIRMEVPSISKREHEIVLLMTKGLNSPEIAEKLFISYHTVENHKRNLRQKTKTKTSAELIHYIWSNNLI